MRLFLLAIVTLLAVLPACSASAQEAPELEINSKRYIVIDAETGHVYAQKDAHEQVAIASLTKIFTAVQALEMASPDTLITTHESDLFGSSATTMGFGPSETYTLEGLIYGMLLPSGNDAAHAIARSLGGYKEGEDPEKAVERFMALVNQRVADMGLKDTHLITPSGWGVPGHHSSAWDVAAMMQHAIEYPLIVEAIGTRSYTTSNGALTVTNTNKLMNSYDALLGGKTGYDDDAGWCLVEVAEHSDRRMIAVTLDGVAPDDWYDDNRVLLEYGFNQEASGTADWSGDAIAWQDPAVAQMERAANPDVALAGSVVDPHDPEVDKARAPDLNPVPTGDPVGGGSVPIAILSLVLILGVRGGLAYTRWPFGRARPVDSAGAGG
jgi:D-alanyl-D-alanine carboxypeptidase (penicillin-binding protein 5/6)